MKTVLLILAAMSLAPNAFGQQGELWDWDYHKWGVTVMAGPAFPSGDFADLFGTGFTGYVEVPYNFARGFKVFLGAGLSRFRVDNDKLATTMKTEGQSLTTNIDAPYWVFPIVVGINVSYHYAHLTPYFTFTAGMYFQKLETSGSYTMNGVTTTLSETTQNWTQGAIGVGLGTYIPFGDEGWAIDLNGKFNSVVDYEGKVIIQSPSGTNATTRAIKFVSVMAGLSYTFH